MTRHSRLIGLAIGIAGLGTSMLMSPARAVADDLCRYDEETKSWIPPTSNPSANCSEPCHYDEDLSRWVPPAHNPQIQCAAACYYNIETKRFEPPPEGSKSQCARDIYSYGVHRGYVGTRAPVLEDGKRVWVVYAPDRMVETTIPVDPAYPDGPTLEAFVPGAPTRISPETGSYVNARVVSRDELQLARDQYTSLTNQHGSKVELVTAALYLQARDSASGPANVSGTGVRTTHVLKWTSTNTAPGTDPKLAELPVDPRGIAAPIPSTALVQTVSGSGYGSILYAAQDGGTVAYLSAFFSEKSDLIDPDGDPNDPRNRDALWFLCEDYNGNPKTGDVNYQTPARWGQSTRDDLWAFDMCNASRVGNVWGPIIGAWVDSGARWNVPGNRGVKSGRAGRYDLEYPYIVSSQFWDTMYVTLNFQPLDIRAQLGARWFLQKRVQGGATPAVNIGAISAYADSFTGLGYGAISRRGQMPTNLTQWGGALFDTRSPRSVNFGVEVAYMNGRIEYRNEERPGIPLYAPSYVFISEDEQPANEDEEPERAPPVYLHAPPPPKRSQVAVDLSTGMEAAPDAVGPVINRVQVAADADVRGDAPDGTANAVYDADLLQDIGRADFANTDIYVFGPTGDLINSRIGLRQNESPGLECVELASALDDPNARTKCTVTTAYPPAEAAIADFIRNRYPGSRYKIIVINRSTGYMGKGFVKIGGETKNGLWAYDIVGEEGDAILMRPPNLKVDVKRIPAASPLGNDVCSTLSPGEPCEKTVGFEGGGLTTDEQIVITTDWRDWDGSPLPASLPGFMARLTRVVAPGQLGKLPGGVTNFDVRPNRQTQVVKLSDPGAYHYYLHVSGTDDRRCSNGATTDQKFFDSWDWFSGDSPACASFANKIRSEILADAADGRRPARYVPLLVPVFDALATDSALRVAVNNARESETRKVAKVEPIYKHVYRAEQQFSVFELEEFRSPELVTRYDKQEGRGKTSVSFGYDIRTDQGLDPLDPNGPDQDLIWSLGFEELLALVNEQNAKVGPCTPDSPPEASCFHDLETLLQLSPAQQLAEVQGAAALLTPQDYLALQLYLGNDRGNALYTDYDIPYPLISVDVAPIELARRENLAVFGPGVQPPPPVTDDFHPIRFEITRPACLTITAKDAAPEDPGVRTLVTRREIEPGTHYYVLDGGELNDVGLSASLVLSFSAEVRTGTTCADGAAAASQFKSHRADIDVSQDVNRSDRSLGEIVEHNVNILDGSLRLSREDVLIGSKGPALALVRSYTNLGTDSDGLLGRGWSHSLDMRLVPTSTEEQGNRSVPDWVYQLRGATSSCTETNCVVEDHLYPSQTPQVTGVLVNGTSFRRVGATWEAASGRHGHLAQNCSPSEPSGYPNCFEFTAEDGSKYLYDYPKVSAPSRGELGTEPTFLSLQDGLLERLAFADLRLGDPEQSESDPGSQLEPTSLKRIVDRFGYALDFTPDATDADRVGTVTDAQTGRSCTLGYEPLADAGCEVTQDPAQERLRSLKCLTGAEAITVHYCFDANGNLSQVKRGRLDERYEYVLEGKGDEPPPAAPVDGAYNLTAVVQMNAGKEIRTTYTYREDEGEFESGITPKPINHFDMVEWVEYPPTVALPEDEAVAKIEFGYLPNRERTVSDARGPLFDAKLYKLNSNGNPTEIHEADDKVTWMTWSVDSASSDCGATLPGDNVMVERRVKQSDQVTAWAGFVYDDDGKVVRECTRVNGAMLVTTQKWAKYGQLEERTDFRGITESWTHDPTTGFLLSHTDGAGVETTYAPSTEHKGRPGTEAVSEDGVSRIKQYHYDQYGNQKSVEIQGVPFTRLSSGYDARCRLRSTTDRRGNPTTYDYDTNDNLELTTLPDVQRIDGQHLTRTLVSTFDDLGNVLTEQDRNGLTVIQTYTDRNQVLTVKRAGSEGQVRSFKYDALGNIRSETDWKGAATTFEYDELGFRKSSRDRAGAVTLTQHDLVGNLVFATDAVGLVTEVRYDELNREVYRKPQCSEIDCGSVVTEYISSPSLGRTEAKYSVRVTQADKTTEAGYDGRELEVVRRDPLGHLYNTYHDALGRIAKTVDEEGIITKRDYDTRGFLTRTTNHGRAESSAGLITEQTADADGNVEYLRQFRTSTDVLVTHHTYDAWGRNVTRQNPGANVEQMSYDGEGNLISHTDPSGFTRVWQRNVRGEVVKFIDAETASRTPGQVAATNDYSVWYKTIDPNGNPEVVVNAAGVETHIGYNAEEQINSVIEAYGTPVQRSRSILEIDGLGNPHVEVDFRGNQVRHTYTARHKIKSSTDALNRKVGYTYDERGDLLTVTTPRNFVRTFERDALGRVKKTFFPAGQLESEQDYDFVGNVKWTKNRRGSVTETLYDSYLRAEHVYKRFESGPSTRLLTNEYDGAGNVIAVTDGNGNRTQLVFNGRNLLWKTILPAVDGEGEAERTEVRTYHDSGAVSTITLPHGTGEDAHVVTFGHDKEGRVISSSAAGETTTYRYDILGRLRTQTAPEGQPGGKFAGKSSKRTYDELGRLVVVEDEAQLRTRHTYDAQNNLTDVEGPYTGDEPAAGTPHTRYKLKPEADEVVEMLQFRQVGGALVTQFTEHDAHGNVRAMTDPNGRGFTFAYDAFDRLIQTDYPTVATAYYSPVRTTWAYDDDLNRTTVTETKVAPGGGTVSDTTVEQRDLLFDRVVANTQRGRSVGYTYDVNGNRLSVTSPAGSTGYSYDSRNRVKTATFDAKTATYRYHQDGRLKEVSRGNGTVTSLRYYPTQRLHQMQHDFTGGEETLVAYTYDRNGNRTSVGDTRNGLPDVTTFDEYDAANRLLQFSQDEQVTRYGYSGYDRDTERVTEAGTTKVRKAYQYDEIRRVQKVIDDAQAPVTTDYAHDNNGNMLSRTVSNAPADRNDFEYDSRDQLVRVTRGPPGSASSLGRYDYDSRGLRVRHADSERGAVEYTYDGDSVIEEELKSGVGEGATTRTTRYHYGAELLAVSEASGTRHYHQDAQGSTAHLSDDTGAPVVSYKHDPWGKQRQAEGEETDSRLTYTEQEYDERTGLYYFGARYYDPALGRFLTQDTYLGDPTNPPSLNRYLYAYSNPARYVDPTGHSPEEDAKKERLSREAEDRSKAAGETDSWWEFTKLTAKGIGAAVVEKVSAIPGDLKQGLTDTLDRGLALAGSDHFQDVVEKRDSDAAEARRKNALGICGALFSTTVDEARRHHKGVGTAIGVLAGDQRAVHDALVEVGSSGIVLGAELAATAGLSRVGRIVVDLARTERLVKIAESGGTAARAEGRAARRAGSVSRTQHPRSTGEARSGRVAASTERAVVTEAPSPNGAAALKIQDDAGELLRTISNDTRSVSRGENRFRSAGAMSAREFDPPPPAPKTGRTILSNEVGGDIASKAAQGGAKATNGGWPASVQDTLPKGRTFDGTVHRYSDPSRKSTAWEAGSWNSDESHRYSKPGEAAVYGSTSARTAAAEVRAWGMDPASRIHMDLPVRVNNVLDLTDASVLKQLGINRSSITGNSYARTHRIGTWARQMGYEGILAPSARDAGANLVIFK